MCGIAGLMRQGGAPGEGAAIVGRMLDAQGHRGPDGRGLVEFPAWPGARARVTLGHVRLAILDVTEAGAQPMRDPVSGNWIVLNGEIYNHRELRAALGNEGGPWRSGSDTETLLRAYARWGKACLGRLRGMFAFALWDEGCRHLWCVRDRLGIKPLYFSGDAQGFAFASEARALLGAGLVAPTMDEAALGGYLRWGCVPEPQGLLAEVRSLPAGHAMTVSAEGEPDLRAWWRPTGEVAPGDGPEARRALPKQLRHAAREHLESDVPVALFLSGGIDSAALAALVSEERGPGIPAVTLAWSDPALDESATAQAVARRHGLDHRVVRLSDDEAASAVIEAVGAMDLPTIDGVNTWLVARVVRSLGFKVALSGLGGDELFGGYPSFRRLAHAVRWSWLAGRTPAPIGRAVLGRRRAARAREVLAPGASLAARYEALRSVWSHADIQAAGATSPGCVLPDAPSTLPLPTRVSLLETQGYMRSMLLRDSDQMGMAHALEIRVPLLDHTVAETAWAGGLADRPGKGRLLEAMEGRLAPEPLGRPKRGFVLPMERWMRGPLVPFVRQGLDYAIERARLRPDFVTDVQGDFQAGRISWSRPWGLAVLGLWAARLGVARRAA